MVLPYACTFLLPRMSISERVVRENSVTSVGDTGYTIHSVAAQLWERPITNARSMRMNGAIVADCSD